MTWKHEVKGRAIHSLGPTQTCTCEAHHVCMSCQGQDEHLRAVNAKLLEALEGLIAQEETRLRAWKITDTRHLDRAREAIEEARK